MSGHRRHLLSLPAAAILAALTFTAFTAGPAVAAPAHSLAGTATTAATATTSAAGTRVAARSAAKPLPARLKAFYWARSQYGKAYEYGGIGPSGYDCSGLVMEAYRHAGIALPRTTYGMLGSRLLVRVGKPVKGDLAFYGSGHVELYAHGDWTFGAHAAGQIIGWIQFGPWWHPTAYYRVR
ncbi:MAG TPA: NlpC/P60 family protein [Streptosporangiaceae bacterium]|nr:NlpC/P60 family protein [Streptosporangiaceae bacterium]